MAQPSADEVKSDGKFKNVDQINGQDHVPAAIPQKAMPVDNNSVDEKLVAYAEEVIGGHPMYDTWAADQRDDPHTQSIIAYLEDRTTPAGDASTARITNHAKQYMLQDGKLYYCDSDAYMPRLVVPQMAETTVE